MFHKGGYKIPISKKWSAFTKENVNRETDSLGVYELGDTNGDVHYIGEGKVKTRLLSHFARGGDAIPGTKFYRVEYTYSKARAVQKQNALLKKYEKKRSKLPRFNRRRG